jgi:hypothetical protein
MSDRNASDRVRAAAGRHFEQAVELEKLARPLGQKPDNEQLCGSRGPRVETILREVIADAEHRLAKLERPEQQRHPRVPKGT